MKKFYVLVAACACVGMSQLMAQTEVRENVQFAVPVPGGCPVADAGPDVSGIASAVIGPATVIPGVTYSWSPTTALNNPNIPNPTVRRPALVGPPRTYTYTLTMSGAPATTVTNGDFSQGNTGFSTQYTYISPNTAGQADQYTIAPNPLTMNGQWCDLSGSSNNVMLIDGYASGNGHYYWSQTVPVQPNTDYTFAFDAMSLFWYTPAQLGASINGVDVIQHQLANTCAWEYPQVIWNTGSNTTAQIALFSFSQVSVGNDFAIDNIRLTGPPCPTTTDVVTVELEGISLPCRIPPCSRGELSVYPNPAQGVVNVALGVASDEDVQIDIRDRNGMVVRNADARDARDGDVPVDVQGLAAGMYIITVRSGSEVTTKRFVVEK